MTRRTIGSVMDDINEWQNPHKPGEFVYYVTAFFTDKEVLSVGKKDMDAALEVKGLLQEIIEVPQEFILEPKGQSKSGLAKWNLKAFGPPEGVWTYNTVKDGSPNVRGEAEVRGQADPALTAPPGTNVDASIRASVALKAAAVFVRDGVTADVLRTADVFDAWLAMKSSGEALPTSEEKDGGAGQGEGPAPSSTTWTDRVKEWPTDG